jgi:hypothetical protein
MPSSKTRSRSTRSFQLPCSGQARGRWLRRSRPDFLSWGSQRSPLHRYENLSSSPGDSVRRCCSFGTRSLRLVRGPPLPFLTTSTVYSDKSPAGLLHPATGRGVRHVAGSFCPVSHSRALPLDHVARTRGHLSRDALPCEAFPSSPALRRVTTTDTFSPLLSARAACAPVLPPVHRPPSRVSPTSRSCSGAESVAISWCGHLDMARCSPGLVPSRRCCRPAPGFRTRERVRSSSDRLHVAGPGCASEEMRRRPVTLGRSRRSLAHGSRSAHTGWGACLLAEAGGVGAPEGGSTSINRSESSPCRWGWVTRRAACRSLQPGSSPGVGDSSCCLPKPAAWLVARGG